RRLTVWSAGCATGEEVYTIAMLLIESGQFVGWDLHVIGSDISRRVLQTAKEGVYGPSSFRAADAALVKRYFVEAGGKRRVRDNVRDLVSFRHSNLVDPDSTAELGTVDVVFCRNVLIYFAPAARQRLIDALHRQLAPGGYLLLGHSESLAMLRNDFD